MKQALVQAEKAYKAEEIPVGAIVVYEEKIIGRGYNQRERLNDPTAHAEIIAITAAANTLGDWRLNKCSLYVTKEPCPMCAGAIVNARLEMVIFGCYDEEAGCCGSLYQLCGDPRFKTKVAVKGGVLEKQSLSIIQDFFKVRRIM
ncbi:MAG: nucleoside deaminase [Candidatus Marinimicrobia bacterium]|jgi:tRNA(adenine34) deaminase|nr:nucleoside deaminase [Candidatus Neomarinimicrobiota bacterium]MBT3675866.1 nucleoside deaminase [Candidatus Neomarinimicrobiota bacterium]MBT3763485.1 nucleoside deaminase [Candidatus Neomarinimicrobiota bacterium]MBT4068573.1 nucleoside deaminase [Candidatus Neomarinimicrobiota bacterium]MBT4271561.1 nucleoside deaminase [Candidatus Neomarinimicrobiota bacterium]